jgi:hypothetical protein
VPTSKEKNRNILNKQPSDALQDARKTRAIQLQN